MDKIVIAFGNDNNRTRIADILDKCGYSPKKLCKTGREAIRAIRGMGGGVVVCGYKLMDMTADDLGYDLSDMGSVIAVAQPSMLELCENEGIYKLATPLKKNELITTLRILLEAEERRFSALRPERTEEDKELINQAKLLLMEKCSMTEPEAHRFMQKKSMDSGFKLISTARIIIKSYA